MKNYSTGAERTDCLDILMSAAAGEAGKSDIGEYLAEKEKAEFSYEFIARMKKITSKEETPKRRSISLARRLLVACIGALIICALTIGTIAGMSKDIAKPQLRTSGGALVLTYDMNGRIGQGERIEEYKSPVADSSVNVEKDEAVYVLRLTKDGKEYEYTQRKLTPSFSAEIGDENSLYFEVLVKGKYSGAAAVFEKGGEKTATLAWNDGKYAYTLSGTARTEELVSLAESMYEVAAEK